MTFGDGAKGKNLGNGNILKPNLPNLQKVILVEGLATNLISISQFCDQGYIVIFL